MEIQQRERSQRSVRLSNKSASALGDLDRFKNPGAPDTNIKLARKQHSYNQKAFSRRLSSTRRYRGD